MEHRPTREADKVTANGGFTQESKFILLKKKNVHTWMSECGFVRVHVVPTEVKRGPWRPSLSYSSCEPPKAGAGN